MAKQAEQAANQARQREGVEARAAALDGELRAFLEERDCRLAELEASLQSARAASDESAAHARAQQGKVDALCAELEASKAESATRSAARDALASELEALRAERVRSIDEVASTSETTAGKAADAVTDVDLTLLSLALPARQPADSEGVAIEPAEIGLRLIQWVLLQRCAPLSNTPRHAQRGGHAHAPAQPWVAPESARTTSSVCWFPSKSAPSNLRLVEWQTFFASS